MQTGDGLLARLPQGGRAFSLDALSRLAAAANRFGNGLIEVTARGSLQIRGLSPGSALGFSGAITALGVTGTVGPPIVGNPLAGLDPTEIADVSPLVALLRARCDAVAATIPLGAKISVAVDGGGVLHLDAIAADIRLRADGRGGRLLYHLAVGGDGTTATRLGAVPPDAAGEAVASLLAVIGRHGGIRARDIVESDGAGVFASAVANMLVDTGPPEPRAAAEPIGRHPLRDGAVAVGVGLAFGQAAAGQVIALVEAARIAGASAIVPAEGRALLALGVRRDLAAGLAAAADRLGFITRADDSRRSVIACSGAPACAAGKMPARDIAPALVAAASGILDGSVRIHLSGCAKGCAHAGPADLTLVGSDGVYGLVVGGDARAAPSVFLTARSLADDIAALGDRVRRAKKPGESSAEVLARLGAGLLPAELAEASAR